ncbi:hypothetical protein [Streptomyces wuyuanensis]|uniref:Uncharacterized protein n=1 Tax=Streptomyces wuyuanensis TaxID=1196353 RepID=A0A1G9XP53_9ACTN|nr:hypothetical protein [Streptomyces wuyuanensis]SDM98544.1 hypothetical protein SAMN05444921_116133 [Streptomyces wuyuanensis]
MRLLDELILERGSAPHRKTGTTCGGTPSTGTATGWELRLPGRPVLTVHDTRWNNGERDLVLYKPHVVPEIPAALSNLHNRLRSGIEAGTGGGRLRIMAWATWVDRERPRIKKSFTTAALAAAYGLDGLRSLTAREGVTLEPRDRRPDVGVVDLDDPQDELSFQHAVFFPADDEQTPAEAFVHLKVLPVLRHIGWLPRQS